MATFAAFAGVLRNGWILYDDPPYVLDNRHVRGGFRFTDALWFLSHSHGSNWHPLTSWSHMLDVQLFGLDPVGPHAVNLVLHALNAVLLAFVLHRLTGAFWRSWIVGALFALHPLRVESVAWISERKDVLSGLLFLLTIEAYRRSVARPGRRRQAVLIGTYALGLMAKPMLVTAPFVLLLLDVWPLRRLGREAGAPWPWRAAARQLASLAAEKAPLFALAAASSLVTFLVQRETGAVAPLGAFPWTHRLANAAVSCWRYVGASLWPAGLAPFYPTGAVPALFGLAAAVALVVVTALAAARVRARPYLAVGWLWYLGMLVPVAGLVQVGGQSHADRYTYLPTIGLALAATWWAGDIVGRSRALRVAASASLTLALAALGVATALQVARWRDTRTLFTYTLAVTGDNAVAHLNLGDDALRRGEALEAVRHHLESIRLAPTVRDPYVNIGAALGILGRYEEAEGYLQAALRFGDDARVRHNLGYTYAQQGRSAEATRELRAALALDPDLEVALVHLGGALLAAGRPAEAEAPLRRALALTPSDVQTHRLLAISLLRQDRAEEGVAAYLEVLRLAPGDVDALMNVAWVRATHADPRSRNGPEAVRLAERARVLTPRPRSPVLGTLAAAYAETGRFEEAVRAGEQALELARAEGDTRQAAACESQLAAYRAGRPFHFGERTAE